MADNVPGSPLGIRPRLLQTCNHRRQIYPPSLRKLPTQVHHGLEHRADPLRPHRRCPLHRPACDRLQPAERLVGPDGQSGKTGIGECEHFLRFGVYGAALLAV